jgi:hypothetical protein
MPNVVRKQTSLRGTKGSLSLLLLAAILIALVGLGALAADIYHNITCRTELQSACDAAALAGARCLVSQQTSRDAETHALLVAQTNQADGRKVSNQSEGTTVLVSVSQGGQGEKGSCTVESSMRIRNWLGPLFGRRTENIHAIAKAAASTNVTRVASNMLFPLAVSLDVVPTPDRTTGQNSYDSTSKALKDLRPGDTLHIELNSQDWKNGALTSFDKVDTNAQWVSSAMDMILGLKEPVPGTTPSIAIGDIMLMSNGIAGQKRLASGDVGAALLDKAVIYLPVMGGHPPFDQRPCLGFIAVKINKVNLNGSGGQVASIEATLVNAPIKGKKGEVPDIPGNIEGTLALQQLSPSAVRLVSLNDPTF